MKRILVITSCTGDKVAKPENQLKLKDFELGGKHLKSREKELAEFKTPAVDLYTGQHHVRLMRGVNSVGANGKPAKFAVEMRILSAGYGFVKPNKKLSPYECTFQKMRASEIDTWAKKIGSPESFREIVAEKHDLILVLLSDDYLRACKVDDQVKFGGPTLLFCANTVAKKLPAIKNLIPVVVSTPETKRFRCGHLSLKGELGGRILKGLYEGKFSIAKLKKPDFDLLSALDEIATQEGEVKKPKQKRRSKAVQHKSHVLPKPRFTVHTPRRSASIHYYIPEWDDRVDPDYDFQVDGITPDRDPYNHDVYAHEIYNAPNYDGILVSKSVIEDNQKKKARIKSVGIHAHVRVPRTFPVMGDCGAFNYINEYEPPYQTEETVEFYESLDFDFGVSIDHLIVPQHMKVERRVLVDENGKQQKLSLEDFEELAAKGVKVNKGRPSKKLFNDEPELYLWAEDDLAEAKRRWALTVSNAEDFIKYHKKAKAKFTPIAGCQGWNVESQTEMFALQQDMGYKYIALGGLVRSRTGSILELLDSVNKIRKPSTKIHLFGIARPEAIPQFIKQDVNSIDSARFLRQAWLSATSNYYTGDPKALLGDSAGSTERYSAIRIPPIYRENSTTVLGKAKKLVNEGHSVSSLEKLEQKTLSLVHSFDRDEAGLEETLEAIVEYDQLMGGDKRNAALYRRLLEDKPWKSCPCSICQETGIDVVVFRRNNRNRRRGFHNTWWFYEFFKHVTTNEKVEV